MHSGEGDTKSTCYLLHAFTFRYALGKMKPHLTIADSILQVHAVVAASRMILELFPH